MPSARGTSPAAQTIVKRMRRGYLASVKKKRPRRVIVPEYAYPYPYPVTYPVKMPVPPQEERPVEGIGISGDVVPSGTMPWAAGTEETGFRSINISYPLIPREPGQGQKVYAYANIRWSNRFGELIYYLVEPQLSRYDIEVIEEAKRILEERLDIDFFKLGEIKAKELLSEEIFKILTRNPNLESGKIDTIKYYLERDIVGLGKIEPLMNDPNIEDISCDGINIPVYVYHRDPNLGSIKTNIVFASEEELNSFVVKMAQRCKKSISIAEPLLDASLPDGSRIQATLGTDIARKGSNFTIRRFAEEPLTPTHMLRYGTLNSTQLAYLWLAIEYGQSILISGGTATGKTSMLNALSLFIRPNLKIVSIEDTPELRLPHPHWIPEVARNPLSIEGTVGEVSLFDLLKSSLRQRPDYIVMGEVRGKEAFVLFQQMASIPGEERVFVLNNSNLKRIPISEIDSSRVVGVPTFNPRTGKMEIGNLKERVTHPPVKELYRIITQSGREVVTTGNHSVFNQDGEAEVVSELKEGNSILIPSAIPCGYNDIDFFRFGRRSTLMPARLEITPELLRLMGYHISEGSLNKAYRNNQISLYNKNSEVLEDMRGCIIKASGKIPKERTTKGFGSSTELSFSNKVIFEFLKEHVGNKSENRRLPDFVFGLSRERIGHLLSGLYSGDSHMSNNYFGYYTTSRQLANDISLLLLTLGIVATIRKRKRRGRKTTDYEIIFYKRRYMDTFLKYVKPVGKKIKLTKEARKTLPDKDVHVDKIRKISKLSLEKPVPVYDLSVPGTQNFIGGFGGVLLHNTGHPSLATIHAASITQLVDRLTTPPISLPPSLIGNINIIIFLVLTRLKGKHVRRADNILEVQEIREGKPVSNHVFKWDPAGDSFKIDSKSVVMRSISKRLGIGEKEIKDELARRRSIIEWMYRQEIFDFREVAKIISTYYTSPERVLSVVGEA